MTQQIHKLQQVYFTSLPHLLYKSGTNCGNMGVAGVGLGLIRYKKIFWLTNLSVSSSCFFLYKNNINNIYINFCLFGICSAFYIFLFYKTTNLISYLEHFWN
jgi:hypothetical protein